MIPERWHWGGLREPVRAWHYSWELVSLQGFVPMHRILLHLGLAAAILLPGCAGRPEQGALPGVAYERSSKESVAARHRAYKRLLSFIAPGMTRRQLYALLPPARPPEIDAELYSSAGVYTLVFVGETYPLDEDFSLSVLFIPVDPMASLRPGRQVRPPSTVTAKGASKAKTIDQLLSSTSKATRFSRRSFKPSPDDKIAGSSWVILRHRSKADPVSLGNSPFPENPVVH